jgi:ribose-phosphate pyrophosphokinase
MNGDPIIFSGRSDKPFAEAVAKHLELKLGKVEIKQFSNDNIWVQLLENVRGRDVFIIQTSCIPVHAHLMEMLMLIDAAKSAAAKRVTAVMPYMAYVRSDKKDAPRICITAKLVANMLKISNADGVLVMDLHSSQIGGFFDINLDHLKAVDVLCHKLYSQDFHNRDDVVLVAADAGEAKHIGGFANRLGLDFAIIDKRRYDHDEKPKCVKIIGDVKGKKATIVDDEIASAGTLCEAASFLKKNGAKEVQAAVTHGVFSGNAPERINNSNITKIYCTDTIPPPKKTINCLEYVTVTGLFAAAIKGIHTGESISYLFPKSIPGNPPGLDYPLTIPS